MQQQMQPRDVVLVTSPDAFKLELLIRDEVRRGAMIVHRPVRRIAVGLWGAEVIQLRPLERRWVRPAAVIGGCVAVLGGAAAAGWWLLSILVDAVAGAAGVVCIAAAGIVMVLALVSRATQHGQCETIVTVRHRH